MTMVTMRVKIWRVRGSENVKDWYVDEAHAKIQEVVQLINLKQIAVIVQLNNV